MLNARSISVETFSCSIVGIINLEVALDQVHIYIWLQFWPCEPFPRFFSHLRAFAAETVQHTDVKTWDNEHQQSNERMAYSNKQPV